MPSFHFLTELRRRHIFRVAVAYGVTAWLLLQLAAIVLPAFGAPGWVLKVLIGIFILLFPVAILLAWAFELTPEGVRRTESLDSGEARPSPMGRRVGRTLDFLIITILAVAVGVLAWRLSEKPAGSSQRAAVVSAAPGATATLPGSAIPEQSIAVLPFVNVSGDAKQQYFSDGLSEDLIIALSQYPALTVIGRESSFQLRNTTLDSAAIGKKLGVAHLLEGSVSRDGDEVRIRAELVDASSGHMLWSDHYDRPYKNLFSLQDEITQAVASALHAKLSEGTGGTAVVQTDRPPSGSLAAYNAYLEGNFYYDRSTAKAFHQAIAAYRRAIDADPKYAAAYAKLSLAWMQLTAGLVTGPALQQISAKARAASDTALKLDPKSAAAHLARGYLLWAELDWRGAEAEYQRALAFAPASADAKRLLATSMASLGRLDEAVRLSREVVAVNPLDARAYYNLAQYLSGLWRLDAAVLATRRAIALQPQGAAYHAQLAVIELQREDGRAALQAAQAESAPFWRSWALALSYVETGDKNQADQALQKLIAGDANDAAYQIAEVYAYRKQPDEAFSWLDRAWRQHDGGITGLLYDPFLLRYKDDPRFAAFCKKVGLPLPGATPGSPSRHQGRLSPEAGGAGEVTPGSHGAMNPGIGGGSQGS